MLATAPIKESFMCSNKHHTKQIFTGHVGRGLGKQILHITHEFAVCADCGDVYADGCWSKPNLTSDGAKRLPYSATQTTLCPNCKALRKSQPSGYVHLFGEFVQIHREEIEELLSHEARRVEEHYPMERIMAWDESKANELTVTTTTARLARRLGHALERAFNGAARYEFSNGNKLAHVRWQRD